MKLAITPRITVTLYKGHLIVASGHLDPEGGRTWLGVSVTDGHARKGYGTEIVKTLCDFADNAGWTVHLSCSNELRSWYERFGFKDHSLHRGINIMVRNPNKEDDGRERRT